MSLIDYIKKRNFKQTSEPSGDTGKVNKSHNIFVIQKHDASRLHFDFRLEVDGVLKSWAVPKGPSLNPKDKRLAMMVEDHPYSYRDFEGTIPKGSYGAGEVIVWDNGTYSIDGAKTKAELDKAMLAGIEKGDLKIELHGQKLQGHFALVKMKTKEDNAWLLIKEHDEYETDSFEFSDASVLSDQQLSRDLKTIPKAPDAPKSVAAKAGPLPDFFTPMLATLVDKPFTDKDWIYEPKLDGYRVLAFVDEHKVQLYSRNQQSLNKKFPTIVKALEALPFQAVIDGEVVGLNTDGEIDFQVLQNASDHPQKIFYYVFDLPFIQGQDIQTLPLTDRKKLLKKAVTGIDHVKFVNDFKDGHKLFSQAQENGYEGVIAKLANSSYRPGVRSDDWLKIKITHLQEAIICGFTQPQGSRHHFGSLLLGVYQDKILHYIGHTGSGFQEQDLSELEKILKPLKTSHSPFAHLPESVDQKEIIWVKPQIVCEVKFAQWTHDNILRHAIYERLRSDKDPTTVQLEHPETTKTAVREAEQPKKQGVQLSHPEKIYWPKLKLKKKDLIEYYEKMAPVMLPYLKDRPESLNRHPNGIDEPSFFQKDITFDPPDFVELVNINSDDVGETRYMICNNQETLLYMANLGCIEINPWNSRVGSLDCPDYFVIDLDPLEVPFKTVVTVAQTVRKLLDTANIKSYCKTSGKKGLHIFIPLHGQYDTELSGNFAKLIATLTHHALPEITSIERSPNSRRGKVYVDFLQNRKGQTIAAPYSLRPTPNATASTPLKWSEVTESLDPKDFTIKTLPVRVKKLGDVWDGILQQKNDLKKALELLR